jgi:hypothetical protein
MCDLQLVRAPGRAAPQPLASARASAADLPALRPARGCRALHCCLPARQGGELLLPVDGPTGPRLQSTAAKPAPRQCAVRQRGSGTAGVVACRCYCPHGSVLRCAVAALWCAVQWAADRVDTNVDGRCEVLLTTAIGTMRVSREHPLSCSCTFLAWGCWSVVAAFTLGRQHTNQHTQRHGLCAPGRAGGAPEAW